MKKQFLFVWNNLLRIGVAMFLIALLFIRFGAVFGWYAWISTVVLAVGIIAMNFSRDGLFIFAGFVGLGLFTLSYGYLWTTLFIALCSAYCLYKYIKARGAGEEENHHGFS